MRRVSGSTVLLLFLVATARPGAVAGDGGNLPWREIMVLRFENLDVLDAEDGVLSESLRAMRDSPALRRPMRSLLGESLRNPDLRTLARDAWLEGALLAPPVPGPMAWVWTFPVEERDAYRRLILDQGFTEIESMDDMTVFWNRTGGSGDGYLYLWWLDEGTVCAGGDREAVRAAAALYASSAGSRGLMGPEARRREGVPDIGARLDPRAFAAWQNADEGAYWWRGACERLAGEIIADLSPGPPRARLVESLANSLAELPGEWRSLRLGLWFEDGGVEWNCVLEGADETAFPGSQMESARRLPPSMAAGYALALDENRLARGMRSLGRLLLQAAGGMVPAASRSAVEALAVRVSDAKPAELAFAWLPPPAERPQIGAARIMVAKLGDAGRLPEIRNEILSLSSPDSPASDALAQMGVSAVLSPSPDGAWSLEIKPAGEENGDAYFSAAYVAASRGDWLAVAGGRNHREESLRPAALAHWREAAEAALAQGDGGREIREAFTRVDGRGASFIAAVNPVRLFQMSLAEAADWSPVSPGEPEPESARAAREMFDYASSGGALTFSGGKRGGGWTVSGHMPWECLYDAARALGVMESADF